MIEFCETLGWGTLLDYGVAKTDLELAALHDSIDMHHHLYAEDGMVVAYTNIRLGPHDSEPQKLFFVAAPAGCETGT